MKYEVLRDCFVGGKYFQKDTTCELPDDFEKSPKNFRLIDGELPIAQEKPPEDALTFAQIATKRPTITSGVVSPPKPDIPLNTKATIIEKVADEELPLYVSDKPPKPKKKRRLRTNASNKEVKTNVSCN